MPLGVHEVTMGPLLNERRWRFDPGEPGPLSFHAVKGRLGYFPGVEAPPSLLPNAFKGNRPAAPNITALEEVFQAGQGKLIDVFLYLAVVERVVGVKPRERERAARASQRGTPHFQARGECVYRDRRDVGAGVRQPSGGKEVGKPAMPRR